MMISRLLFSLLLIFLPLTFLGQEYCKLEVYACSGDDRYEKVVGDAYLFYIFYKDESKDDTLCKKKITNIKEHTNLNIHDRPNYVEIFVYDNNDYPIQNIKPLGLKLDKDANYYAAYDIMNGYLYNIYQRIEITLYYESINVNLNQIYLCPQDFEISFNFIHGHPGHLIEYSLDDGKTFKRFFLQVNDQNKLEIPYDMLAGYVGYGNPFKLRLCDMTYSVLHCFVDDIILYPNYPLSNSTAYVTDSHLHASLASDDSISVNSYFIQEQNTHLTKDDFDEYGYSKYIFNGPYRLTFNRPDHCPVEREVFVPEVKYNKVNESDNEFWYGDQITNAVTLSYNYPEDSCNQLNFSHSTNNNCDITTSTVIDGKITVYDLGNNDKTEEVNRKVSTYNFNTDTCLNKISLNIDDQTGTKKFVPVFQTIKLSAYPNISVTDTNIVNSTCYYDTAVITVSGMKGGLDNGYKFMLKKGEHEFWSEDSIIKIPATIFGGNDQEAKLYVLDNDSIDEDLKVDGRMKRAYSTNIKFKYGEKLDIKNWQVADLNCFEDNTGKISITDWTPKNDDIKFEVWNSEKRVSESEITENLAAGDYNLKIIDGNDCVNDSFQVTVNQPNKLQTSVDSYENTLCYGYNTGKIVTTTTGGTGDYVYSWNNGETTNAINDLKAGEYKLTVTDEHGCQDSVTQKITEPDELKNSLQPSYLICKGNDLKIDDGKNGSEKFTGYEWTFPDGTKCFDRELLVTSDMPAGNYILTSKNEFCFTQDTTNIQFAENNMPVRFLVATESYLGDTLMIVEDSEITTDFTWHYVYSEEKFTDVTDLVTDKSNNHTFLYAEQSGVDTITMYADNGICTASISKEVIILPEFRPEVDDNQAIVSGMFSRLSIGPNPNDGNFTLFANLTEESELTINLLDISRAKKVPLSSEKLTAISDHYEIPFHGLDLKQGVYCLMLTANGETKQIKFSVK